MVDVATLSVKVDTTDLARGEAALEGLAKEGKRTEASLSRLNTTTAGAGAGFSKAGKAGGQMGRQLQNASFQVGDFAVQMASGQRASVALAQQLPQLLGGFGVMGAVLGAVAAIGGALIPVFMRMFDSASDLETALGELEDAAQDLKDPLKILQMDADDLARTFGTATESVREFARVQAELAVAQAQRRLQQEVEILGDVVDKYTSAQKAGRDYRNTLARIGDDFGVTGQAALDFEQALSRIENAKTFDEQEAALTAILALIEANNLELSQIPEELQNGISELITMQIETERLRALMENVKNEAAGVTVGLASQVALLQQAFAEGNLLPPAPEPETDTVRPGGGRSIDSAATKFAADLEALNKALMTERETIEAWRSENLALLEGYNDQELALMGLHKDARLRIEEEYQERLSKIQQSEKDQKIGMVKGVFSDVASLMNTENRKLFNIGKAAAISNAIINTYEGISKALSDHPPPQSYVYAAATAAKGFAAVSAIRSQQFGGGGGGGGGATSAAAPAVDTSPRVALTLAGSENATYTKSQVRDLINAINEEVEGGAIVRLA